MVYQKENFLNEKEVTALVHSHKNTPATHERTIKSIYEGRECEYTIKRLGKDPMTVKLLKKINTNYPHLKLVFGHFSFTHFPLNPHTDDFYFHIKKYYAKSGTKPLDDPYSISFIVPLKTDPDHKVGDKTGCFLIIFNQSYPGSQVRFARANSFIYDRSYISSFDDSNQVLNDPHFSHSPRKYLKGLSVYKHIPWTIGSLIAFPGDRFHCSSNFLKAGIKSKLHLLICGVKI